MPDTWKAENSAEEAINHHIEKLSILFGKYVEDFSLFDNMKRELNNEIYEAIQEVEDECESIQLEDFEDWEIEKYLTLKGYYLIENCPSLKERYKIEAFMEKLRNDPYGPMIIM